LIGFLGTIAGACIAQGAVLFLAGRNRKSDEKREAVRRVFESAGSHVASVTFDKYVEFCELYANEWGLALGTMFSKGPCKELTGHSFKITALRQQWMLWVPPDIEEKLEIYEQVLLQIGLNASLIETSENQTEHIHNAYSSFAELAGMESWRNIKMDPKRSAKSMIRELRSTLGTDNYSTMRNHTMKRVLRDLDTFETGDLQCSSWIKRPDRFGDA
jgi:hypothetical protein